MDNNSSLKGKCALITGGSKGIGLGIAQGFAEAGADLILVSRDAQSLDEARASLSAINVRVQTDPFDLSRTDKIEEWYSALSEKHGPVDILVNSAGTIRRAPADQLTMNDWDTVIRLNLTAVFALSCAFARNCFARGAKGKIINIASLMTWAARRQTGAYTASKGGVGQLTKVLALDWAEKDVWVNAIAPGYILTPMTEHFLDDAEFDAWVKSRTPMGRWGTPEDLSGPAVFLSSDASDFVTGQTLYVDGGFSASV